ncbi:MAG: FadR/GntR family transcriptional regulator [Rhizobiaceae bacterium]
MDEHIPGASTAKAGSEGSRSDGDRQLRRFQPIADHYRLAILEGRLKVGDKLPSEREISERFGAGRSSVREALFTLSREGFVSLATGARARVIEPDPRTVFRELGGVAALMLRTRDGVRELQLMRRIIETGLARQAAMSASRDALDKMRRALGENEKAIGDHQRFVVTDVAFHRSIAVAVGNSMILAILDGLSEWLTEQRASGQSDNDYQRSVFKQHEAIYQAIAARDPVGAFSAMDDHLMAVIRNYWSLT